MKRVEITEPSDACADRLVVAALSLRSRARAADILGTEERWAIWWDLHEGGFVHVGNAGGVIPEGEICVEGEHNPVAKVYTPELADFIVTMGPPLAFALSRWLESLASRVRRGFLGPESPDAVHGLLVADAVLDSEGVAS